MRVEGLFRRTLVAAAAALLVCIATVPQAHALVQEGTWQVAQCGTAASSFVQVPKGKGFANGTWGATMVNAGNGTAGVQLELPTLSNGFFAVIRFAVRYSDLATAQNTNVHFCFSNGDVFDRSLASLPSSKPIGGWYVITLSNRDFRGLRHSLVKMTFAVENTGNLTIGETLIQNVGSDNNAPSDRALNVADCCVLNSCNMIIK